jgi:chitodextrinase
MSTIVFTDNFDGGVTGSDLKNHVPDFPAGASWIPSNPNSTIEMFSTMGGIVAANVNSGGIYQASVQHPSDDMAINIAPVLWSNYNASAENTAYAYGDGGVLLRGTYAGDRTTTRLYTGYLVFYRYKTNSWIIQRLTLGNDPALYQVSTTIYDSPATKPLTIGGAARNFDISISGAVPTISIYEGSTLVASFTDNDPAHVAAGKTFGIYLHAVPGNDPGIGSFNVSTYAAPAADTAKPVMTGVITASNITTTGFTLAWPAATDDVGVTGYEYSLNGGSTWTDAGNVLTKSISGLTQGTQYPVQVRGYDAAGNKADPLTASVTTVAPDTVAPVQTGSISPSAVTDVGFTISWPAATDNVAVTGYEYSIDGGTNWINAGNVLTANVTGLVNGTSYPVRVRAYDAANNKSTPALSLSIQTTDTTAPVLTGTITVGTVTDTTADISWPAGTDNVAVTGYSVSKDAGATWIDVGNVTAYTLTGLNTATNYLVQVRAYDAAANVSKPAIAVSITTTGVPADPTAPVLTGTITVSNLTSTSFDVSWPAASDNVAVTGYETSRDNGAHWTNVGNVLTRSYTGMDSSVSYPLQVRAFDAQGNRSAPLSITVTTLAPPDAVVPVMSGSITSSAVTAGGFTVAWPAATDNVAVTGYETSTDGGSTWQNQGNVLTKTFTGLVGSTAYPVRVRAFDAAGNKATPLSLTVTTLAPPDTTAPNLGGSITTSNVTSAGFKMSWSAATDNVAVASYDVSYDNGSTWTNVGNVLTTNVTGRAASTTYQLQVRAKDAAGNVSVPITGSVTTTAQPPGVITTLPVSNGQAQILLATSVEIAVLDPVTHDRILTATVVTDASTGVAVITDGVVVKGALYDVLAIPPGTEPGIQRLNAV